MEYFEDQEPGVECPKCGRLTGIIDEVEGKVWPCIPCLKELAGIPAGDEDGS